MNNNKIIGILAFITLIIAAMLLLTGCPFHIDSLYGLKVAGDGNGGAFAIYEDKLGGDIYAQKISPDGEKVWGQKGVLLGGSNSRSYSYFDLNIISDSSGGAIVSWPDSSQDQFRPTSHVARLDSQGSLVWQRDFVYFSQLISDGEGGVIIAFDYSIGDIVVPGSEVDNLLLVKIDSQGSYSWGLQGVSVQRHGYQGNGLQIVGDGSGGAIVSWQEIERLSSPTPGQPTQSAYRQFAQRIDSSGRLTWADNVLYYTAPENSWVEAIQAVGDGRGGVLAGWFQATDIAANGEGQPGQIWDIVAQKVDSDGEVAWQSGGVPLEITKAFYAAAPTVPLLTGDGSGGAIVIWRDNRHDPADQASVYAQQVDASGHISWPAGGAKVSGTSLNPHPSIVSDDTGGAIVSYSYKEDGKVLHAQKIDASGNTLWQENGISITDSGFASQSLTSDGKGGAIIAWGVGKATFGSERAFIQRVNTDGKLMWGEEGIRINE
jgi:hypothetical protein